MKRLILLIFCLSSIVSWGQSIKGKVIDAKTKETIPGANIAVPGVKGVGTSTDFDGNFSFTLPAGKTQITVSFVGYKTKTQNVTPGSTVTVSLEQDAAILDDVVIVGYGTQKKESLTAAVATVDVAKAIDSRPVPDVARALQGSTPGLTVRINNGELGSDPTINIRGFISSLQGSSSPLILVDNVEIPSLLFLNPDDVQSVSVLKDASAASIYGAKAANGVLLITTKQGSRTDGKVSVSYSGSFSMRGTTEHPTMARFDGYEYSIDYSMSRRSKTSWDSGDPVSQGAYWLMNSWVMDRAEYWDKNWKGKVGSELVYGRDWETKSVNGGMAYNYGYRTYEGTDAFVKKWTPQHQHNITIAGSAGKTSYNLGLAYISQTGVLKNTVDTYQRYNASLSINSEVNKYFTVKSSFLFTKSDKNYPGGISYANDPYFYAYRWSPVFPIGATYNGEAIRSPDSEISQDKIATRTKEYLRFMIGGRLNLLKGWTADFDLTYAGDKNMYYEPDIAFSGYETWLTADQPVLGNDGQQIWRDKDGQIVPAGTADASPEYGFQYMTYETKENASVLVSTGKSERIVFNANTTYNARFGDHSLKAMVGLNSNSYRYRYHSSSKKGLSDFDKPELGLADGQQTVSGSVSWESQFGWFGRINYGWKDKILLEFNARYEGTSKFPDDLRWKFFPSGSVGYRISEENFWQPIKNVVSEVKLRASYGSLGNQTVPNNMYIPTLTKGNSTWGGYDGVLYQQYTSPSVVRNDVTWETITTLDLGIDARFFKNKLGLTFDWFSKTTTDMFVPGASMPGTYGATAPQGNFGKLRTQGWELMLDFNHRFSNGINLSADFGISDAKAKMIHYTESTTRTIGSWYNGREYGEMWGYVYDRLWQMSDFEEFTNLKSNDGIPDGESNVVWFYGKAYKLKQGYDRHDVLTGSPIPGGAKYKDMNGDGIINSGSNTVDDPGDRVKIGNSLPRYEYSFHINLDWKGFDLGLFFQGVGKRDLWAAGKQITPNYGVGGGQVSEVISKIWSLDNPNAWFPRSSDIDALSSTTTGGSWQMSKHYMLDMSYLRLKTITLGYTIPKHITEKAGINKLRVYFTGENLFTFDNLKLPIDPETGTGSSLTSSTYNYGNIGTSTPMPKYLTVGLQLTL